MADTSFRGFVNAHTHSHSIPYKGLTASAPFEVWLSYRFSPRIGRMSAEEQVACALVVGLENLNAGTTAVIDHLYSHLTPEHVYGVAEAYEALGMRAWVFPDVADLPMMCYTREAYPDYPKAISTAELPEEVREMVQPRPFQEQLEAAKGLIEGWKGNRVLMGLALSNPVWCSDELLQAASQVIQEMGCPLEVHAEESPVEREVSLAQWGLSGVQRLDRFGLLSPRTIVAHCVQVSDEDIALMAQRGISVSHNPVSNMKLHNGVGPVGKMLKAGVNVCLGSDGSNSGDEQSLFPVMRLAASLARLNGVQEVSDAIERQVVEMASSRGYRLWFPEAIADDRVDYGQPVDPVQLVWCDLAAGIREVYVDGEPVLEQARSVVKERGASETVASMAQRAFQPDEQALAQRCIPLLRRYATSR
ncbi:MAG: amidohydrolase family protein [Dehalococcoidia bacterium]